MQSSEDKIVTGIIEKTVSNLHDYVHSEEFSKLVLRQEPRLETYFKVQIDGQIHHRIEKATNKWLNENVPLIVKSEFDTSLQGTRYMKMSNLLTSIVGETEHNIELLSNFQRIGISRAILRGSSLLFSFFLVPGATFMTVPILFLGVAAITLQFSSVEEISRNSFEKRVKLISREKLHTLMHQNLEKHLRAFHRHIFSDVLAIAIQNMSKCVDLMTKNETKTNTKQNDFKHLLSEIL